MAQIQELYISSFGIENTKGLEYATNLKFLYIYIRYENYGETIKYDFSHLNSLTNLKELYITGETKRITNLGNMTSLEKLEIYLSGTEEESTVQLEQIKKLTNLKLLNINGGNVNNIDGIGALTKLEELSLNINIYNKIDLNMIGNLTNLKRLKLNIYQNDGQTLDYSFLNKLTKIEDLEMTDTYINSIDMLNISNMTNLIRLVINAKQLTNVQELSKLSNLETLVLNSCKLTDISFIKNLTKLNYIEMQNNFITDISPLENISNAYYLNFLNNPIKDIDEKYTNILRYKQNGVLQLTEYELQENLTFKSETFKEYLVNNGGSSYDLNRDEEISKYEIGQVEYLHLYGDQILEHAKYMTQLRSINLGITATIEEQNDLIKEINLLGENVQISINYITIVIGNIPSTQTYVDINEVSPILVEMQREGSRIYKGNITLKESEYNEEDVAEIKDGKIYFKHEKPGDYYYAIELSTTNESTTVYYEWKVLTEGNNSKEIEIEDSILKKYILEKHDIDKDGKITENDMLNITTLEIESLGITSLKGLENAKNLTNLWAYGNKIKDISPIVDIQKQGSFYLVNNEITDITYLANSKLDEPLDICLDGNYIDFSAGSENLKVLEANYAKEKGALEESTIINNVICSQKYGKPEDKDKIVQMDSKIKNKLISYGIDDNNDGNLSREEMYNAIDTNIDKIDLSGLGITNINGLEYLIHYNIDLSNNEIVDISVFSKNKNTQEINLSNNKIKDISCFANNNNFLWGEVDLSYNQIEDISSIKTWPAISKDTWRDMQMSDPMYRNISINLSNNKIKDISAVKDFKHLQFLDLSNNNIDDISPLASYNFKCFDYEDENGNMQVEELLSDFQGINLNNNYINIENSGNKKAIEVFKDKGVTLNLDNQTILVERVFSDVKTSDWYHSAVDFNYKNKMILGTNENTFSPNENLTRAMLVTILHRIEGYPYVAGTSKFKDVQDTSAYYYVAVKWATKNNIVSGYDNGNFGPNDPITREQLAVILNKYCSYKGKYKAVSADFTKFKDTDKISEWAKWGMNWAVGSGVITGNDKEKTLNPQGTATRAEAASMLYKYCQKIGL